MSHNEDHLQHFDENDKLAMDFDADHSRPHHPEHVKLEHGDNADHSHGCNVHKHDEHYNFNKIPPDWNEAEKHGVCFFA